MRRTPRGTRAAGGGGRRRGLRAAGLAVLLAATAGCEDQFKWIPFFSTMTEQPSREAYEVPPMAPPEGAMPVHGEATYDLLVADTALSNPLEGTDEELARGAELYRIFCTPCHAETGAGGGPVVGPNRIPPTPLLNLHSENARGLSDGYIWGMITHGRGLMPSYRRIPPQERWYVVSYVRELQRTVGAGGAAAPAGSAGDTAAAPGAGEGR